MRSLLNEMLHAVEAFNEACEHFDFNYFLQTFNLF